MPLSSTCIARYRADVGLSLDANHGIYQWDDLTGNANHLVQTNPTSRPTFDSLGTRQGVIFDGGSTWLNLPAGLNLPGAGCAVVMCSRGSGAALVTIGTVAGFSYGASAGPPDALAMIDPSGIYPFPKQTYLPALTLVTHGFRCTPLITRLIVGTNQISDLAYDTSAFNSSGGTLGQSFTGEIFEMAIYSPAPDDNTLRQIVADLQDYNGIIDAANTSQIIFIGDSNIAGCPAVVCQLNGELLKPLVLAQSNHTIDQQLAVVNAQLTTLDLSPFQQTFAVVCAGSNDAINGQTPAQIVADLTTLCTKLQSLRIKVMLATIPDPALSAVNAILQNTYPTFADALIDWATDQRLADPTNTSVADDGVKASILQPGLMLFLTPPPVAIPLTYASFYSAGQTFTGSFGKFVQS